MQNQKIGKDNKKQRAKIENGKREYSNVYFAMPDDNQNGENEINYPVGQGENHKPLAKARL